MLDRIDRAARQIARPVSFYLGKLQDGLALDSLTGYSRRLVPFFADHPYARLIVLTKCALVDNLMGLEHKGQTILSWSLSPAAVWRQYEPGTPSPRDRLATMRRCGDAGFRLRAVIMPILPVEGWREAYAAMLEELLGIASLERITLGSMCSFPNAIRLTEQKLGSQDEICRLLSCAPRSADGRYRFDHDTRVQCYRFLLKVIRDRRPNVEVGLCLEERGVFHQVGLESSIGQCNCVL
jgi:spore photoproduct lyase